MNHDEALDVSEKLTGERWIPYPSEMFYEALEKATPEIQKYLIEDRRNFLFPSFLKGEPQEELLKKVIEGSFSLPKSN